MVKVRVYVEGGGDARSGDLATQARRAFGELIFKATGKRVSVIACGPRTQTLDAWKTHREQQPGDLSFLLLDSEGPVRDIERPIEHLKELEKWGFPEDVPSSCVHLMIQVMETWLIADPKALSVVFGRLFDRSKVPKWPNLEQVSKSAIFKTLKEATAKKPYAKGAHSFKVLAEVDPAPLQAACPSAKRFFDAITAAKSA